LRVWVWCGAALLSFGVGCVGSFGGVGSYIV
jgi:hypothetical protein